MAHDVFLWKAVGAMTFSTALGLMMFLLFGLAIYMVLLRIYDRATAVWMLLAATAIATWILLAIYFIERVD